MPLNEPTQENNWVHIAGAQLAIERDENGASVFHGLREAHCDGLVPLLNGSLSWPLWTPLPWPVPPAPPRMHPGDRGVRTDPLGSRAPCEDRVDGPDCVLSTVLLRDQHGVSEPVGECGPRER